MSQAPNVAGEAPNVAGWAPDVASGAPDVARRAPAPVLPRELDATTPWVRWWLRAEGLAGVALGAFVWFAIRGNGDWLLLLAALLVPDLSMLGYLGGPHVGAIAYNLAHNWFVGGLVMWAGLWFGNDPLALAGAVLVAHTGVDRILGYGLKYPTGFADTHLGRIGRQRS